MTLAARIIIERKGDRAMKVASAFALAVGLIFPAYADDNLWSCHPLAETQASVTSRGGVTFVRLTDEQWNFLRGVYVTMPDTPESLPPGDRAMMSTLPDGGAVVSFVDGDQSCVVVRMTPELTQIVMSVGLGEVIHGGSGL